MRLAGPLVLALLALSGSSLPAADWPQFRCDAARTASSPEQLPARLEQEWVRHLPAPRPAFPGEVRLRFDASYEPVVLGGTMFVPSMLTDSVTALDAQTGAERWQFFAEGPVRFAPVAWESSVYFVSDDGYLYCVAAADGTLRWKFRWLPPGQMERKLLGNLRLISLRPARGGPVLDGGVLYFGAGLWSTYGVSVHALDARTGRVIWTNGTSNQIPKANMDHGTAHFAGLTPHGYLAIVNRSLVVPCGAQLPAFLDLKTGRPGPYTMGWGGRNGLPKGTWLVAGTRNYLSHGGDLYDLARTNDERLAKPPRELGDYKKMLYPGGFTRLRIDPNNQKDLRDFSEPVLTADSMFENDHGLVAYDLTAGQLQERGKSKVAPWRRDDPYPDKWEMHFRELWRMPSPLKVHIKAGGHLYLGGEGTVQAVAVPSPGEQPRVVWQAAIQGTPHRMLAAHGRLFVVTREGAIYAFAAEKPTTPIVHNQSPTPPPPTDAWTKTAADVLRTTKIRDGYALVLGIGTGRLAEEILRQSTLDVIVVDPDAAKADALRRRLHRAGLYGTRASVHLGDPLSYPLPPYFAQLVVSEKWSALGPTASRAFAAAILHPLRPYGGTACIAAPPADRKPLIDQVAALAIPGATARSSGDWVLVSRVGPLPGSADWSHAEGDPANTGASEDRFVKAPLDLLWFDTPRRWFKTPGATLVRVAGGRVLIKSERLTALDAFTGRRMWEADLPSRQNPADQIVALDDAIYVAGGETCLVLDPATGRKTGQINLPAGVAGSWGNLRIWQDCLVAQCGKSLVSLNRSTGQLAWKFECNRPNLSVAVGGGKVFCAELPVKRRGDSAPQDVKTRAMDIRTGEVLWQIAGGSEVRYCGSLDLLVSSAGVHRASDGVLVSRWPEPAKVVPPPKPDKIPRPLFVVDQSVLFGTAESFRVYDLVAGGLTGKETSWIRRGCTQPRASTHFFVTRYRGNAACVDLATRKIISFWNVRTACSNSLFPADGLLNMPSLTGGCTCNYLPVSQAYAPASVIPRPGKNQRPAGQFPAAAPK